LTANCNICTNSEFAYPPDTKIEHSYIRDSDALIPKSEMAHKKEDYRRHTSYIGLQSTPLTSEHLHLYLILLNLLVLLVLLSLQLLIRQPVYLILLLYEPCHRFSPGAPNFFTDVTDDDDEGNGPDYDGYDFSS
jgi:hypothetical protein